MKSVLLTCLLSPLFLSITVSDTTISTDLNEIILESDLIVYAQAIDACEAFEEGIDRQFIHFEVITPLKGTSESLLSINTGAVYAGDIPHQLIDSKPFQVGQHYLLFLQKSNSKFSLLIKHTMIEIEDEDEKDSFLVSQSTTDSNRQKKYNKQAILNSIEAFLYNEVEVLESEILAMTSL